MSEPRIHIDCSKSEFFEALQHALPSTVSSNVSLKEIIFMCLKTISIPEKEIAETSEPLAISAMKAPCTAFWLPGTTPFPDRISKSTHKYELYFDPTAVPGELGGRAFHLILVHENLNGLRRYLSMLKKAATSVQYLEIILCGMGNDDGHTATSVLKHRVDRYGSSAERAIERATRVCERKGPWIREVQSLNYVPLPKKNQAGLKRPADSTSVDSPQNKVAALASSSYTPGFVDRKLPAVGALCTPLSTKAKMTLQESQDQSSRNLLDSLNIGKGGIPPGAESFVEKGISYQTIETESTLQRMDEELTKTEDKPKATEEGLEKAKAETQAKDEKIKKHQLIMKDLQNRIKEMEKEDAERKKAAAKPAKS